jgi:signal transduction histidine kinase
LLHSTPMHANYDPWLVIVSIGIAIFASYVALDLAERLSTARRFRWAWWLGGSLAMGVGIWSMHFVGMLAFHLPVSVTYDLVLVIVSVLVAIAASALALFVASRPQLPVTVLIVSSLLMGGAINGMHYIGMAAMIMPATIVWRHGLVAASIAIAIAASFVALLLAFKLRRGGGGLFRWMNLWAAIVMGIAISGMHYTGMAAARFTPGEPIIDPGAFALHTPGMALGVISGAVIILSLSLVGAVIHERERLLWREQRARQEAEGANRLKDEFLATLSHELRTPLNVILGRTQILKATSHDPARVAQAAETIARNGEALRRLVDDLLDVSRMTLGGLQLDRQPVDLAAILENAANGAQPAAEAKGIRFSYSSAQRLPRLIGDPIRLQQVIWNLLANAVKFTPAGGEIRARLTDEAGRLVLVVTDTGEGINPEFLPHVFDMFRQGEPANNRTHGGLGLGLSIVRRLVELHGGTVAASSAGPGKGATFTVSLPYQSTADARAHAFAVTTNEAQ